MNFFDVGLILSLTIALVGVVYRVSGWSGRPQGGNPIDVATVSLISRLLKCIRAFIEDVLLLARSGRTGKLRWLAHSLVFIGFMGLLLFHALDETITARFFPAYEPTLDPWQFLRNLFGALTMVGLGLMVYRRVASRQLRAVTRFQDWAALLVVGGIILSGFFLEASKIISPAVYDRMVVEYSIADGGRDATALKSYWVERYGVVFSEQLPMDEATLELGASVNEDSCIDCHDDTTSAFVSRPLASMLSPVAPAMNISRADTVFWYVHILFCFIGLAALPFGKFFHALSAPANLMARQGRRDGQPESSPVRQGLGFDACTRCGECSLRCSVAPSAMVLGNSDLLPSEKLVSLKDFWSGKLDADELGLFAEGSRLCTECLRCTDICPAGINLQDLWISSKPEIGSVVPDSNQGIRVLTGEERAHMSTTALPPLNGLADNAQSFWDCVQCTTCTSVCPVVAVSDDPSRDLDLTPQQIMNLLRMGLKDQTLGARMVWSCTTCYKCQEHCPQNIRVADVLYELRNTVATDQRGDN